MKGEKQCSEWMSFQHECVKRSSWLTVSAVLFPSLCDNIPLQISLMWLGVFAVCEEPTRKCSLFVSERNENWREKELGAI